MQFFIKLFFVFAFLYHVLKTFFVHKIGFDSFLFSLSKEVVWSVFILSMMIFYRSFFRRFLNYFRKYIILFFGICVCGYLVSFINDTSFYDILVGLKYDLYFLFIFLSSVFLGFVFFFEKASEKLEGIFSFLKKAIVFFIFLGFLWSGLKIIFPEFFMHLGYGPVGDFVSGKSPPVYYRTGPGGFPRFSGFFSGPNNLGYFLVLFSGFFICSFVCKSNGKSDYEIKSLKKSISGIFLYFLAGFLTISRGFLLGILPQVYIWLKKLFAYLKISSKYLVYIGLVFLFFLIYLSVVKGGSTVEHFESIFHALREFSVNLLGYGLGSAGPAVHHNGFVLPENVYLQILIDIGIVGFLLWILFFVLMFLDVRKMLFFSDNDIFSEYLKYLSIGLLGLLLEGMFLHVFEDSMVNYLFFIPFGILFGYMYMKNFYKGKGAENEAE